MDDKPINLAEGTNGKEAGYEPELCLTSTSAIPNRDNQVEEGVQDSEVVEGEKGYVLNVMSNESPSNPDLADVNDSTSQSNPLFILAWKDSFGEVAFMHTEPVLQTVREPKDFEIVVHRGQVMRELIKIFKGNPDVDFTKDIITAAIILPNGEREQAYDGGGVMRDLLTEFWDDFYEHCTPSTTLKVPCLRHDMEAADWKAVGRIIVLGWILQKVLPI